MEVVPEREPQNGRKNRRHRIKTGRRNFYGAIDSRATGHHDGRQTIILRSGRSHNPIRQLLLKHQDHGGYRSSVFKQSKKDGAGNVIGDISDNLDFSFLADRGKIEFQDIHFKDIHPLASRETPA